MLYRGHLISGTATGTVVASVAFLSGRADTIEQVLVITGLCAAFALFPDLDVASVPQRWFYRVMAGVLVVLIASGRTGDAALLGLLSLLPLIDHHRGWTHRWWAVPIVPLAVLILWAAFDAGIPAGMTTHEAISDPVAVLLLQGGLATTYLPFYAAMVTGYAVHLLSDRIRPRLERAG